MRASTVRPRRFAAAAEQTTSAAAPSLIEEAFAAVTVPVLREGGLERGHLVELRLLRPLVLSTTIGSPFLEGTATGTISSLKSPPFWAATAVLEASPPRTCPASRGEACTSRRRVHRRAHVHVVVGVPETVVHHRVDDLAVSESVARARVRQHVRGVRLDGAASLHPGGA